METLISIHAQMTHEQNGTIRKIVNDYNKRGMEPWKNHQLRERWEKMNPDEREKMKEKWKQRCSMWREKRSADE